MTFLQPFLLWGLPLAGLPILIHLLNLRRHRRVDWGAMQFLLQATRQRKGHTRLRHLLILLARMVAVAAIVFVISRPLVGRWFGLFGGRPETVIVVLDRSASMAAQDMQTGQSKRSMAIQQITTAIRRAGVPRNLVLIENCSKSPQTLASPEAMRELPEAGATDAPANLPQMLQSALDYVVANRSGRTDIWVCSDLQAADWQLEGGQWSGLRSGFKELKQPVRFHLLTYPEQDHNNLSVRVLKLRRRRSDDSDQLVIDVHVRRARADKPVTVPLGIVVDGARSVVDLEITGEVFELNDHVLPLDRQRASGWGKVELPNDANPRDNVYFFTYGDSIQRRTVVVSDEPGSIWPLRLAAAPPQAERVADVQVVARSEVASRDLTDIALLVWQAPLPDGALRERLEQFVRGGGQILFLPGPGDDAESFLDHRWGPWERLAADPPQAVDRWRDDAGLLEHTDAGQPLPVTRLAVQDYRQIEGNGQVLARLHSGHPLMVQVPTDRGGVHWLATLPQDPYSNLAREGVVLFAAIQRALAAGAERLMAQQFGEIDLTAVGAAATGWDRVDGWPEGSLSTEQAHVAGVYRAGERLLVRNRPPEEDTTGLVTREQLAQSFAGLNYHLVEDTIGGRRSLVAEIWRGFAVLLLVALIVEGALCLPDVRPRKWVPA
jgi:hypothetical protein